MAGISGSAKDYNGDILAMCVKLGVTITDYNGSLLAAINILTGTVDTNLNNAQNRLASMLGYGNIGGWKSFIPTTDGTLEHIAWFDADDLNSITKNGSEQVSQINDKSGGGNNAARTADAFITLNTGAAIGSFTPDKSPSLYGTGGSGQKMNFNLDLTTSDIYTLMTVVQADTINTDPTTGSGQNAFVSGDQVTGANSFIGIRNERLDPDEVRTAAMGAGFETSETDAMVFGNTWDGDAVETFKDGTSVDTDGGLSVTTEVITQGNIMGDTTSQRGWLGCLHEVHIYKGALTTNQMTVLNNYLIAKWEI